MEPYFSVNVSVVLTLLATCMWGSWMQVVKHRGAYPIAGLIFLLYTFSLVLVGTVTFLLAPSLLTESIWATTVNNGAIVLQILFGGALMAGGLFFSLQVMSRAGLLLATTISGAVSGVLGIATSLIKEGIPNRPNAILLIFLVTAVSIVAGTVCNAASRSRDRDLGREIGVSTVTVAVVLMSLTSAVLSTGWSLGTATGTASGFPAILTCLYMALGSFLCALGIGLVYFTKNGLWKQVLCLGHFPKKPLLLGAIAAACHYGGNLISIYSMPALSATLSFLFGRVGGLVTIAWGLYYKEFPSAGKRTKTILTLGVLAYLLALALLGYYTYN